MPVIGKEEKIRRGGGGYSRIRNQGGGGVDNLIWRIGSVDTKMQGGVCQRRGKEKFKEGRGSRLRKKNAGGVSDA